MNEKLKTLGRVLSKEEQKKINGGFVDPSGCGEACSGQCTIDSGVCKGTTGTCAINQNTGTCQCHAVC
jgi:hypothetical protein